AATWVLQHDRPAGRGTTTLAGNDYLHLPLSTVRGAVGVLALHAAEDAGGRVGGDAGWMPLEQRQLVDAITHQAAVAIERMRVDVVEAVIESIEDGLVVLTPDGAIEQMNEVACAILDIERATAHGARFEELGTSHPHYLR